MTLSKCLGFVLALSVVASAEVRLPKLISDHMVLQSERPAVIWGWAKPAERIVVKFAGQKVKTTAGASGSWKVELQPMAASMQSRSLIVKGHNKIVLKDVVVGEVWLASGQSNMAYAMSGLFGSIGPPLAVSASGNSVPEVPPLLPQHLAEDLRTPNCPHVRLFRNMWAQSDEPENANLLPPGWEPCISATLTDFSAVAYYFARDLQNALQIPVGVIESAVGGTRIEEWTPLSAYNASPIFNADLRAKTDTVDGKMVGNLYHLWIEPLQAFPLRGILWYQGESNVSASDRRYAAKMELLIATWRKAWGAEQMPFYFVQIAPFAYSGTGKHPSTSSGVTREMLPQIWEQQTDVLAVPNTGMAATTDIVDDVTNIHPGDKWTVGHRLALLAEEKTYGIRNILSSGPRFRSMKIVGNQAIISFDNIGDGLLSRDGKDLTDFVIGGEDGTLLAAYAAINGDEVVVSNPTVAHPTLVRFGWNETAQPNLSNKAGLPALPFRTDRDPLN